jgi:hypothetical protein
MTIKIKSWRLQLSDGIGSKGTMHRAIRESDWRKLMKLVKAVDKHHYHADPYTTCDICAALVVLEKKK